jgi:hypothetical protein
MKAYKPHHQESRTQVRLFFHPGVESKVQDNSMTKTSGRTYQDGVTQDWAAQTCHSATQLARVGRVQTSWFNINSLGDPEILADAVRAALTADVIVVSVYVADELPAGLCTWFEEWLPITIGD